MIPTFTCSQMKFHAMSSILIQGIGFVGVLFFVLSFQQTRWHRILFLMVIGQVIFLVHFVLLGAWTAVGMNMVGAARTVVFQFRGRRAWAEWNGWPFVFVALFILAGLLARESWTGVLPVLAMSIETIGLWMKNLRILRLINIFPHPFWFAYNVIKGSWAGIASEIFVFSSIIVAIIRYDILKEKRLHD
jgi:hypothetical protein